MIKVFLSSTYKDLVSYRQRAAEAIQRLDGYHCIQMENFGARDSDADEYCPEKVAECDLFVLLVGPTYGSRPPGSEKSYTELEYEAAVQLHKPRLIFASSPRFVIHQELFMALPAGDVTRARKFRERVAPDRIAAFFTTEEELAARVGEAISNWKRLGALATVEGARKKYLDYLEEANRYLTPRGIMQTTRTAPLGLDEVYVSLFAERIESDGRLSDLPLKDEGGRGGRPAGDHTLEGESALIQAPERQEVASVLGGHKHIVLLGEPGAGKTTLVKFLTLLFARAARNSQATSTRDVPADNAGHDTASRMSPVVHDGNGNVYGETRLPIPLRIASYADAFSKNHNLSLREFLPAPFSDVEGAPSAVTDVLYSALKEGRALILLDGMDEIVDPGARSQIARRIEDFVAGVNPNNCFIVTSRPAGYRAAPLGGDFVHFTIGELDRGQIARFLARWYLAVERFHAPGSPDEIITARADREVRSILDGLDNAAGVRRLASNPLMLTILALIHKSGARLPSRRVELYEMIVRTLLEDWQLARGIPSGKIVREYEARMLLGPLAYWMHAHKPSGLAGEAEVKERLAEYLGAARGVDPEGEGVRESVDDFLRRVREHTGLFVERAPRRYGFMHLTFEEYFAARELIRRHKEAPANIHKHRSDPRWEESILLAIGMVSSDHPDDAAEYIRAAILAEGEAARVQGFNPSPFPDVLCRDLLMAARCIADSVAVDAGLASKIIGELLRGDLNPSGPGKFALLRIRVEGVIHSLQGTDAESEVLRFLASSLEAERVGVRSRAMVLLGKLGSALPQVGPALLAGLADKSALVRASAVRALGELRMPAAEASAALVAALGDKHPGVRGEALRAAVKLKPADLNLQATLIRGLEDTSPDVRIVAVQALGESGLTTPEMVSALRLVMKEKGRRVLVTAVQTLVRLGQVTPEVLNGLNDALRDEDKYVRKSAIWATAELRPVTPDVLAPLLAALKAGEVDIRSTAARALVKAEVRTPEVVRALLDALADESADVRSSAAWALGGLNLASREVVAALLGLLDDSSRDVKTRALSALVSLKAGSPEVARALIGALEDPAQEVRAGAAWALGELRLKTPDVLHALAETLSDPAEIVKASARQQLAELAPEAVDPDEVISTLTDHDKRVRALAALTLGKLCGDHRSRLAPGTFQKALDALRAGLDDPRNEADVSADRYYPHLYDLMWETLWVATQGT